MGIAALLLFLAQDPVRVAGDEVKPGLLAVYRSLSDPGATLTRIDAKPVFNLGESSPHPRIPPGPFEVVWTGLLLFQDADAITLDAVVSGEVKIEVDGRAVAGPLEVKPGFHRLAVTYRSKAPARLQIYWQGKTFSREPIPAWKYRHLPAELPEAAGQEAVASRGRERAARLGCARCHRDALPDVHDPPPGPSLADLGQRVNATWLLASLDRPAGQMPSLFTGDRAGLVERWIVAQSLLKGGTPRTPDPAGDHRMGRRHFVSVGCAACHFLPDEPREDQPVQDRLPLEGLNDRLSHAQLAAFLANPKLRYPDGRMPCIPVPPNAARDIAAFVLLWSKPAVAETPLAEPVQQAEIDAVVQRLGVRGLEAAGQALLREKRCAQCHSGLGESVAAEIPIKTPAAECRGPRFTLDAGAKKDLAAYLAVAARDRHPSEFDARRRRLERSGCLRCHSRDSERSSPLEEAGSTLGGAWLQILPFLKTPRLTNATAKYTREYLVASIRDGVSAVRHSNYSYRMPAFGDEAEELARSLAEGDGDDPGAPDAAPPLSGDPTLPPLGPTLVGFGGYSCVSCHIWRGKSFAEPDPGAIAPELTTVTRRIRREWFDRWVEDPARVQPGTPMPQIFKHGLPATLGHILEGDAAKQKEALWAYFSLGKDAPAPKPLPLLPLEAPADGPLVAQIPLLMPDKKIVESICVLFPSNDLLVYDVGTLSIRAVFVGARVLRQVKGRMRQYVVSGTPVTFGPLDPPAGKFEGYDRLADGVRIRSTGVAQEWRLVGRKLGVIELPPAQKPPPLDSVVLQDPGKVDGVLEQPGYRAIAYPRPKTVSGEDLVMPGAIAADPRDGRVFVASMKRGELFVIRDPDDTGKQAKFEDYTGGLFQEAYSMVAESGALYVLHRRNLTKITDTDGDGKADRFDRVAGLPHGVADTYDYGYGLTREKTGSFTMTYAPYANTTIAGSGSLIRLLEGGRAEEIAYGFRNPLGWCTGPEGDIYYTDNQGEWVATNKLCRIVPGRYYGFPNNLQRQHVQKPFGKTTVWVPYGWAHSINGVTYDATGGKFGPFAGQFFMAELMFGGAIIRASVELVNGEMQGSCFPFWGKGLMGPVVLTFDPKGRLWVGSITEPGWMAQPDRGAVYRIDFTGATPFEIREIRALRDGFRLLFTAPVDPKTAADPASYLAEHYRYEYTGSYGSPELDRTRVPVEKVAVAADGLSADLTLPALVKDRVYMITARGVKSAKGEAVVHPTGAYTLHEIPR
jgi:cytochrome c553